MDWGKWSDGLWKDLASVGLPVLIGAVSAVKDNPEAPLWAACLATGAVVAFKRLFNWVKHRDRNGVEQRDPSGVRVPGRMVASD
jgi:hypothetical protein